MKRILVTGGAGFIGSHLCERLIAEGNHVVCLDSFLTGREEKIARLSNQKNLEFVRRDVTQPMDADVDQIFNLACSASPSHYRNHPVETMKASVLGALNMLELALKQHARILQASTSEVYGDPQVHPQPEGYWGHVNPIGPRSCYDEGKRCAETLFFDFQRRHGLEIKVVRIFNTYGPGMAINDGRVVSNFIVQSLHNRDITIYGDGLQTRSFCYIDDMIDGLMRMMDSPADFHGPVNLGNPFEVSIRDLAQKIVSLTGSGSKLIHLPLPEDDPARRRPDICLARTRLSWDSTVSLDAGLCKTIEYFQHVLSAGRAVAN